MNLVTWKCESRRRQPPGKPPLRIIAAIVLQGVLHGIWLGSAPAVRAQAPAALDLGRPDVVAPGVTRYHVAVPAAAASLVHGEGPLAIDLLKIDPRQAEITTALAKGDAQGRAPVLDAVTRAGAIAGVNASFFVLESGDSTGVLRVDGRLLSDASRLRGAVAFVKARDGSQKLLFDRVTVRLTVRPSTGGREMPSTVDAPRTLNGLALYTPRFAERTRTAPSGTEWLLAPRPTSTTDLVVVERRDHQGASVIPKDGAVLSYGGSPPPASLNPLRRGGWITVREHWVTESRQDARQWARAEDVVGGVGLLLRRGRPVTEWTAEHAQASFVDRRHPRTMIGVDKAGFIWLVAVDGRQPAHSIGMTLPELRGLAVALGLTDALNLDGGGSTTMVVGNRIVNRPSDPAGPRPVSDVILVTKKTPRR